MRAATGRAPLAGALLMLLPAACASSQAVTPEYRVGTIPGGHVLLARQEGRAQWDLYIADADGAGRVALAASPEDEWFSGTTASGRIVFERRSAGQSDLYSILPDGTGLRRLTDTPEDETLACLRADCAATGPRLLVVRTDPATGRASLYAMDEDGDGVQCLATSPELLWPVAITPEGRVLYWRSVGGQYDLYGVNLDGTDTQAMATNADPEVFLAAFQPPGGASR